MRDAVDELARAFWDATTADEAERRMDALMAAIRAETEAELRPWREHILRLAGVSDFDQGALQDGDLDGAC